MPILDPYTLPDRGHPVFDSPPPPPARAAAPLEVLIVDDSLSVRRVLASLASNAGWVPSTARDGLEALKLLQQLRRPDRLSPTLRAARRRRPGTPPSRPG